MSEELKVGSDASWADVEIPAARARHAILRKHGFFWKLRNNEAVDTLSVNGQPLPPQSWKWVFCGDQIKLCGNQMTLHPALYYGARTASIDSSPLFLTGTKKRKLCQGLYVNAPMGSWTAIMGPAGCGKSVLLSMLANYRMPDEGVIRICGVPLVRGAEIVRDCVGFVPQAEIMIPELTVAESLDYRLRLRFPRIDCPTRQRLVRRVCISMGFADEKRLIKFMNSRIGTPESKSLSGGERRRANIAHELICQPLILLMDEPISGLSSRDAKVVMETLRAITDGTNMTMLTTIHQPSPTIFEKFDDLLLIGYGGTLAYYGKAKRLNDYFTAIGRAVANVDPTELALDLLKDEENCIWMAEKFRENLQDPAFDYLIRPPAGEAARS